MMNSCTSIIQNKLPVKKDDLRSFIPPYKIRKFDRIGLYDLRASINMTCLLIFQKLGLGKTRPTIISL